jgi:hypothetical protein
MPLTLAPPAAILLTHPLFLLQQLPAYRVVPLPHPVMVFPILNAPGFPLLTDRSWLWQFDRWNFFGARILSRGCSGNRG